MLQRLGRRPGEPARVIDHGPSSARVSGANLAGYSVAQSPNREEALEADRRREREKRGR